MTKITLKENLFQFKEALESRNKDKINKYFDTIEAVDIAKLLSDSDNAILNSFCSYLNDEKIASVLEQADEKLQLKIIENFDKYRVLYLFNYMQKDDIVDVLGNLSFSYRKEIINLMTEGDRKVIKELLGYSKDSAGGIMTTEYIALNENIKVKNVINKIKEIAPKTEVLDTIFIINNNNKLTGTVELREILLADNETELRDICDNNYIYIEPDTDQEEVSLLVSKYDLKVIPVINNKKSLLGIITVDDIIDVITEENTEDMLQLAGVSKEENLNSTFFESVKLRLPWLFVNLLTAFLASFTVKIFEGTIEKVVALSATMSIVAGMGGNAGTQTLSIMVRSIAMGEVKNKDTLKLLIKEVLLGLVNGASTGILTGLVVYLVYGNIYLGIIIFIAMIANLIISGFFGLLIPIVLKKMNLDPALASSIFLTTATDVLGFFVFLGLANLMIVHLI